MGDKNKVIAADMTEKILRLADVTQGLGDDLGSVLDHLIAPFKTVIIVIFFKLI